MPVGGSGGNILQNKGLSAAESGVKHARCGKCELSGCVE